jgi:hypothetical protein
MFGISRGRVGTARARRSFSVLALVAGVMVVLLFGCRDEFENELDTNQPPDTYLTGVPMDSALTFYRVHLYWYGNDVDGRVVGYEYAITDSFPADEDTITYHYTTKTDSIFLMPVGASQQSLGHRFYVRAIDNLGAVDPEPAWAFFGAVDLIPPIPIFTVAEAYDPESSDLMTLTSTHETTPSDTIPAGWNARFEWTGIDSDRMISEEGDTVTVGEIVQYEYWLLPIENSPITGGPENTSATYENLSSGKYTFQVRAVDDAGFKGLDPTVRTFVWNKDPQTYFERMLNPATGDSAVYFLAEWTGSGGELIYFEGDTIPLVSPSPNRNVRKVDVRMKLRGYDPDALEGAGVSGFQYRLGVGQWSSVANEENEFTLSRLTTTNTFVYGRCADGLGRRDGSPAGVGLYVNRAPNLRQNIADAGEPERLMHPFPHGTVAWDSIRAWGDALKVQVRAIDPDSSTYDFHYSFRLLGSCGSVLYGYRNDESIDGARELFFPWPVDCAGPGDYQLGVRIQEDARGDAGTRTSLRFIPFTITD